MPASRPLPIVALDVDGVLNPHELDPAAGWSAHPIAVPARDLPDSPFLRGGGQVDLTTVVHLHPELGRRRASAAR